MILHLHAERLRLLCEILPNPTHAQYPQHFSFRIMADRRRLLTSEFAFPEIEQWVVEASEGTEHEEHSCVSSRGVDCGRDVGDTNVVSGTVCDVALVVAGS